MGAVLIPEFNSSPNNAKKLLFQTAVFFGIVFTLISTFLYWQSYTLVELLAPGFEDTQTLQASIGLGWVMWLVPLTVLAGIATAYLHSKNKFAVASLGTLIINITIIAGLFLVYFGFGSIFWVAMFALLGGALRLLSQLISVGMKWDPVQSFDSILLNKGILLRYMQAILSGSILLFIPVLARAFASYSGEGGVAIMNYSTRLIEFPLAIAITVFTVTLFPRLSDSFINNKKLYNKLVSYGSQATLGISILIMIALILLSSHYVSVVFNYGHMQTEDLLTIQQLISIGLFVLPLQGMSFFLTAVFHSQKNTKVPLVINSMGLLVFILIYTNSIFGTNHESIMWAMVCSYGLTFVLQLFILKIDDLRIWKAFLNSEFITGLLVSSATLYLLVVWINNANYNSIITLFIAVLAGFISLVILAVFNPEFRVLIKNKVL
jgi:peptidoglycan biosynthesis protein MviN/MurJ (putative lipid II flippase)